MKTKAKKETRDRAVTVRLFPADHEELTKTASELGLSLSATAQLALRRGLSQSRELIAPPAR